MTAPPVCIAGGGPVGMTLALVLAARGIRSTLLERNAQTTQHPKMDITNARSMELFGLLGLVPQLRAVAVPESHVFDVAWVTAMNGHQLHRFHYPSVDRARAFIRERNDGTQPREPPMRVSQVEIEPVLKSAIDAHPLVDVRFGTAFESFVEEDDDVVVRVHGAEGERAEDIRCRYLIGCDGGASRVRACLQIALEGESRVMDRFMTHFRSSERTLLQRWGMAWHYQSNNGTLIAQNDVDLWTLHSRFPAGRRPADVRPSELLERFAGTAFAHEILVANAWTPHLLVAERYGRGRVWLAGDAAHQYIPTGGYGMNTGIGDAFDLGWKLAAVLRGFAGTALIESYDVERRPVGLRNREASRRHNATRIEIAAFYENGLDGEDRAADGRRARAAAQIAAAGNLENENTAIELGYVYRNSPTVWRDEAEPAEDDDDYYAPSTAPGSRLPSVFLADGTALHDRLGLWFTFLGTQREDALPFEQAAQALGIPLQTIVLDDPIFRAVYGDVSLLIRPDQHIAWRSNRRHASAIDVLRRALGLRE